MISLMYDDNELDFLEDTATELGFTNEKSEKCRFVFVQRFLKDNDDLDNNNFSEIFRENLIKGNDDSNNKDKDAYTPLRDYLKRIYEKLEEEGCNSKGMKKDKLQVVRTWLRERRYPEWLKKRLWQELQAKATPTNKMGPVLVKPDTLGMVRTYRKTVPLESYILFEVKLDRDGHLILLERAPSGIVYCLCPSEYAPEFRRPSGATVLPQYPPSPEPSFQVNEEGCEQIVAIIAQDLPPLNWLPRGNEEPLELDRDHLNSLLDYINNTTECKVLWTEYTVIK